MIVGSLLVVIAILAWALSKASCYTRRCQFCGAPIAREGGYQYTEHLAKRTEGYGSQEDLPFRGSYYD